MNSVAVCIACAACGAVSGLFCGPLLLIGKGCRPALRAVFDAAALLLAGLLFVACSALFRFPALRLYMLAASAFGFWLYLKSLHRLLAFLAGKMYNTYRSGRRAKRAKPKRPSAYDERGKI